ncbi:protease SohB [Bdellovibrio svalbardensis]|uniref:Protease SohB n=1 Tax=Bdellovibrio svalbardensis TaxID=2972972 RepID=A0ABT6DML4_9BACT|nr:protease SohB [Bdellovibrio svalbardensis]MDG0816378.1 protease SohB [Bdellovibrio svalbardensis]
MDALQSIGVFAAQTFLILFAIIAVILVIAMVAAKAAGHKNEIEVELLHKKYKNFQNLLKAHTMSKTERKDLKKQLKQEKKESADKSRTHEKKIFVIDFEGDVKASAVENLREEVTAVLTSAKPEDEVVVRIESPGGVVHGYGLAASQLLRIRDKGIPLTVCVDKVAASGGYLMSVTANKILSAPFAIVGSIGVVAQVPNFHRILKKHDVDVKEYTAGEFKRTVSLLGEITSKGEEKFQQQLEETHILFKSFVQKFRPQMNLQEVATGEYWYGEQAITKGLVDEIRTSDDYLMALADKHQIIKVKFEQHESFGDKLSGIIGKAVKKGALSIVEELETRRFL